MAGGGELNFGEERSEVICGVGKLGEMEGDESRLPACARFSLNFETFDLGFAAAGGSSGDSAEVEAIGRDEDAVLALDVDATFGCGPTLITSPRDSNSTIALASSVTSSSLSSPTSWPFSSLPIRTAFFKLDVCEEGNTDCPRECEARVAEDFSAARSDLKRDVEGLGGGEARVASRGTSCK